MKRNILLLLTIILFTVHANSQNFSSKKLRLGARVDPYVSWMSSDNKSVDTDGLRFGVNAGLRVDYYFQDQYAISTGITINNTGGKLFFNDPVAFSHSGIVDTLPENTSITYKLQYLEIPFTLKLISRQVVNTKYFARLGFSPQLNIKATADASSLNDNTSVSFSDETINDEISLFNLSYIIGGGVEIEVAGNTSLLIGLFYKSGFTDITRNHKDGIIDKGSLRNFGLNLGLLF